MEQYEMRFKLNKVRPVREDINEALVQVWGHPGGDSNILHWKHDGESWLLTLRVTADDGEEVNEFKKILQERLDPTKIDNGNSPVCQECGGFGKTIGFLGDRKIEYRCELCGKKELCDKCGGDV